MPACSDPASRRQRVPLGPQNRVPKPWKRHQQRWGQDEAAGPEPRRDLGRHDDGRDADEDAEHGQGAAELVQHEAAEAQADLLQDVHSHPGRIRGRPRRGQLAEAAAADKVRGGQKEIVKVQAVLAGAGGSVVAPQAVPVLVVVVLVKLRSKLIVVVSVIAKQNCVAKSQR